MKILNKKRIKLLIFTLVILAAAFVSVLYLEKPSPSKSLDLPILVEADKYTTQIANYQFNKATKYSTPENKRILNSEIKAQMDNIARKNGLKKIKFKEISFEKSLLVNENLDHQIVAEKLVYDTPKVKDKVFYLRFEIIKQKNRYQISNTKLIEI